MIVGENASGRSSVVEGLKLVSSRSTPDELKRSLHKLSQNGYSKLRVDGKSFVAELKRSGSKVEIQKQEPIDPIQQTTKFLAVINPSNPFLNLEPTFLQQLFAEQSGYGRLQVQLNQAQRELRNAQATAKEYLKMRRMFHGDKTELRRNCRKMTNLLTQLRKLPQAGQLTHQLNTKQVDSAAAKLDEAWRTLIQTVVNTDLKGIRELLQARREWYYLQRDTRRQLMAGSSYSYPQIDRVGWSGLKEARQKFRESQKRHKPAKSMVKEARDEVESGYKTYSQACRDFLKVASSTTDEPIHRELLDVKAKLYFLKQKVKRYDEAKRNYLIQQSAIPKKGRKISHLHTKISRKKSAYFKRFNRLATRLTKATLGKGLNEVCIDQNFVISVREAGGTLRKPDFHEKVVLAVISAAVTMNLYQRTFPFIAFDDLPLGFDLRDRLARALCTLVEHVIYTEPDASVRRVKVM